jgi:hypothetical protein
MHIKTTIRSRVVLHIFPVWIVWWPIANQDICSFSCQAKRNFYLMLVFWNFHFEIFCLISDHDAFMFAYTYFKLDIVDENYISPENLQRPRIHTDIEHLAFSSNGNWLATVERRDDKLTTPEIKLKFWSFNPITNKYCFVFQEPVLICFF